ncbi:acyl carrier protein [Streptomyces sp. NPDC048603]|uniref:acyl carrier protein n=1 Tax=Streptomyces sp. NPDC048603 TaxID=3365577 RepID=UPI0037184D86
MQQTTEQQTTEQQTTEPQATAPHPTDPVTEGVLAAVGAASDFPVDVLTPDQSLANDLDFDSLMFTELAERLVATWPQLPMLDKDTVRPATTIADVIGWVRETLAGGTA